MGKAMEIISGVAVAPGATITALTMAAGDSLTIRNFVEGKASLLTAFQSGQTTLGQFQIRSPRLHDNNRGIQFLNPVAHSYAPLWLPKLQELVAQDQLFVGLSGSAGALDQMLASLLIYYDNLPGVEGAFITPEELKAQGVDIMTCVNTLTSATGGTYEGAVAINATNDLMKANTNYALVGYEISVAAHAVTWRGSDTGNLRVGGPARINADFDTRNWFVALSQMSGLACIPVFNSANKANTFVEVVQDENAAASTVTSIFVELGAAA